MTGMTKTSMTILTAGLIAGSCTWITVRPSGPACIPDTTIDGYSATWCLVDDDIYPTISPAAVVEYPSTYPTTAPYEYDPVIYPTVNPN